jgi:23S rRNA (cytosine1962-C5)-methyltransferase
MSDPTKTRLKIRLSPAAERAVKGGHPWVYADRIKEENRHGAAGEVAVVYDRNDKFLALALIDPQSPIRLRILHVGKPITLDDAWWRARMDAAVARRTRIFDLGKTTGFRWINGESDGWPGLVLDRYGDTCVLKIYSAVWFPRLTELQHWIGASCGPKRLVLRLSRNIAEGAERDFSLHDGDILGGEKPQGPVGFLENGLRFEADVLRGQKTGFFLDQRENRIRVGLEAEGKDVLNVFSHAGGFSVHAAAGGARSTVDLDISAHALKSAVRNMALNAEHPAVARCRHETIKADAFEWLGAAEWSTNYDLIIIDPPSMAMRQGEAEGALRAYEKLVIAGLQRLRPGGLLFAASCSAHVPADDFFNRMRVVASKYPRHVREVATFLHAADHPAAFPEANYLKCITLRMSGSGGGGAKETTRRRP